MAARIAAALASTKPVEELKLGLAMNTYIHHDRRPFTQLAPSTLHHHPHWRRLALTLALVVEP
ncbi:hypothetical protein BM1_10752 [Bipolaris maydis]|nr:hypothetical protein BM1_10752 [Bipolaris maydis]